MPSSDPRKRAFIRQRVHAARRGIPFLFSFDDWFAIWERSGKWPLRGRGKGRFHMARNGDAGPYAIGNVSIVSAEENCSDAGKNRIGRLRTRIGNLGAGRGWSFVPGAREKPYLLHVANVYVGHFPTKEECVAAYRKRCAELKRSARRELKALLMRAA